MSSIGEMYYDSVICKLFFRYREGALRIADAFLFFAWSDDLGVAHSFLTRADSELIGVACRVVWVAERGSIAVACRVDWVAEWGTIWVACRSALVVERRTTLVALSEVRVDEMSPPSVVCLLVLQTARCLFCVVYTVISLCLPSFTFDSL